LSQENDPREDFQDGAADDKLDLKRKTKLVDENRNYSDPDKSLVVEVVNLNNKDQSTNINNLTTTTDSMKNDRKNPTIEEIQRILDAAEDLFDHRLMGDPKDYQDIDRLLSWICHANNRRGTGPGKVSTPAGLVYWAFHKEIDRIQIKNTWT